MSADKVSFYNCLDEIDAVPDSRPRRHERCGSRFPAALKRQVAGTCCYRLAPEYEKGDTAAEGRLVYLFTFGETGLSGHWSGARNSTRIGMKLL